LISFYASISTKEAYYYYEPHLGLDLHALGVLEQFVTTECRCTNPKAFSLHFLFACSIQVGSRQCRNCSVPVRCGIYCKILAVSTVYFQMLPPLLNWIPAEFSGFDPIFTNSLATVCIAPGPPNCSMISRATFPRCSGFHHCFDLLFVRRLCGH
jgi:hypothetical protein